MCGIAGLLGCFPGPFPDLVGPQLAHRGPDDSGVWQDDTACLVHRRLAILDLSPSGHQPMASTCGRWLLVFNGEIYNHATLRSELKNEGQHFRGNGDSEVLLAWMIRHGSEGLKRLRGMFAFCLFDTENRSALLARDPHGIKPLYLWNGLHGELAFASELRALMASGLIEHQLNTAAVAGYLLNGSVAEPATLVSGVQRLPAGHLATWKQGQFDVCPWNPLPESQPASRTSMPQAEAVSLCRSALKKSVLAHMVSDVPVGLFLSAGLDSAALLALAPRGLNTFTIGFSDTRAGEFDESKPAASIAAKFGANHTLLTLSAEDARDWLPQFLKSQDQPSIDGYNTWCVSRLANQQGLKVALSGLGGDEMFGGYPSFQSVPHLYYWRRKLGIFGCVGSSVLRHSPAGGKNKVERMAAMMEEPPSLLASYRCFRGLFSPREVTRLMNHWGLKYNVKYSKSSSPGSEIGIRGELDGVAWLEGTNYLRNQLLPDSDVMAMAAGLELRIPLVDAVLQQELAIIPAKQRLAPKKDLLQKALHEIPEWFLQRPKQGFRFPFQLWLDDPSSPFTLEMPPTPPGLDLRPWYRRWSLMVLDHWLRENLSIELGLQPNS